MILLAALCALQANNGFVMIGKAKISWIIRNGVFEKDKSFLDGSCTHSLSRPSHHDDEDRTNIYITEIKGESPLIYYHPQSHYFAALA